MAQPDPNVRSTHRPLPVDASPVLGICLAVADAKGRDLLDLPPLGRTIDADGLEALLEGADDDSEVVCSFTYAGCSVTVTPAEVRVEDC